MHGVALLLHEVEQSQLWERQAYGQSGREELVGRETNVPNAGIINSIGIAQNSTLRTHSFCSAFVLVKGCSCCFRVDSTTRKARKYHDHQCAH